MMCLQCFRGCGMHWEVFSALRNIIGAFWLSPRNFFQGGAKSIVMQISIVILLFSDQVSGRDKSFQGGAPPSPPVGESQHWEISRFVWVIS